MLTQGDAVKLLSKNPPPSQVVAFSIFHAYIYSKASRGNLPSEILSKLLSVQRKLIVANGNRPLLASSPIFRAFEAIRKQLLEVNKRWFSMGALAFGPLGTIGATAGDADAKWAWTKATDGKIKVFPDGDGGATMGWMPGEMDAGRVIDASYQDTADPLVSLFDRNNYTAPPPGYDGPPPPPRRPDQNIVDAQNERREQDENGTSAPEGWRDSVDDEARRSTSPLARDSIDEGAAHLARLRQLKEEKEKKVSASPSPAPPTPIEEEPPAVRQ